MKTLLTAALLAVAPLQGAVASDEGLLIETSAGVIRAGARCGLAIQGLAAGGRCLIGRAHGSPLTIVRAGGEEYEIQRTGPLSARFVRTTDGVHSVVGTVYADGNCWVGTKVAFCAR